MTSLSSQIFKIIIPIQIPSMSLPLYQEDLMDFFQRSNEPFIFPYKTTGDVTLENYEPGPHNEKQSIKAIKGVMDAVVHLRLNLIMPTQLRYNYVIKKKNNWGLRHAICERSKEVQNDKDSYNPEEYEYHDSEESQLMWNLGRIWLRFFTNQEVRIKYMNQKKIEQIVDKNVNNQQLNTLIKKLLKWKAKQRITLQNFLSEDIFISQQQQDAKSFYTSVLGHIKMMSNMTLMQSQTRLHHLDVHNAYVKQIRYRCFLEYLDIDFYFEHLKNQLLKEYNVGNDKQKAMCEFTRYMMSIQNYFNMVKINGERLEIGQRFEELEHRLYYTRFAKRMVMIRDDIEKKARKLRNNQYLPQNFKVFLRGLDSLNQKSVYNQFKSCLSQYAQYLNEDLRKDDSDIVALKLLVKIYIIRTSSYLFSEMRTEVFEPFLKTEKRFNLKKVLSRINESTDRKMLKQLLVNIKYFYFS